jgi:hypothetical protein
MAKFLKTGHDDMSHHRKAATKAPPIGEPATTVRMIRLGKPANDNPAPLVARLRWWAPPILLAVAAVAWQMLR